jgi:phosphoglucosamine mutase
MQRRLFGTDGIRGKANQYPMRPEVILQVAIAIARKFSRGNHRHTVVIGKDTRVSSYMVETALCSGFVAMGMEVLTLGPVPTPTVSILTRSLRADLGVMISASHNPYEDNGIKFFGPDGVKLSDADEADVEAILAREETNLVDATHLGKIKTLQDASGRYIEFAKSTFPRGMRLDGFKIVIDCAHGAAYKVAPAVLWELGADIIPLGVNPNGTNINDQCGATAPGLLREAVIQEKAHLGIALDGDADRLIMVDENGHIINGDQLMALIASTWLGIDKLRGKAVVATQMSNLGFERYLRTLGLDLVRTAVGDRYVIEAMQRLGCNVGGEQSGHIILSDYAATGDGLIGALQILRVLVEKGKRLSELAHPFALVPQLIKNVRISNRAILKDEPLQKIIRQQEQRLQASSGRLLIRPSGTEPLIRVMGEADDEALLKEIVDSLADHIYQYDQNSKNTAIR